MTTTPTTTWIRRRHEFISGGAMNEVPCSLRDARDIQNRTSRCIGTAAMEDRRFRSLFGARIKIVLRVWLMLWEDGLRPKKSKPKHLLWTLYFLKVYRREAPGCSAVDGLKGAIDPKMLGNGCGSSLSALPSWWMMW
jgi:hypothetical protein